MSMTPTLTALGTGGASGALISWFGTWLVTRRKNNAEATEVISRAAVELLEPMRGELESARVEIQQLRIKISALTSELESTQKDLRETRVDLQIAQAKLRSL